LAEVGAPAGRTTLVLGGAASGKSTYAESLVLQLSGRPVYIATAQAFDDEMTDKIAVHRDRRGDRWTTIEEPFDLSAAIAGADAPDSIILVDCLTLWLSNLMAAERDIDAATLALTGSIENIQGRLVLVANEVGLGIVPENAMARSFRNLHGTLNQAVAEAADRVVFVAAGLPLALKGGVD
jgi:adenosylcobinamide kinase / adenosylcobinamide-phosphate guanylyltransferase